MPAPESDVWVWGITSLYKIMKKIGFIQCEKYLTMNIQDEEKIFEHERQLSELDFVLLERTIQKFPPRRALVFQEHVLDESIERYCSNIY